MTHWITSLIASYGLYAVFILMAIDAVFPAASEFVMLYAGTLTAGAIADRHPTLFGTELPFGANSYLALARAGTFGYLLGRPIVGCGRASLGCFCCRAGSASA